MNRCYHHSPQGLKTKLSDKIKKNYKSQRKQLKAGQFLLKTGPRVSRGFLYVSYPPRIEL